jgi:DNA-directed RNA polymerase beta' subunit
MTATALKQVNNKLKKLPDSLINEVESYIDFLAFKHSQEVNKIPQWHKDEVAQRVKLNKKPIDAFDMIDNLDE